MLAIDNTFCVIDGHFPQLSYMFAEILKFIGNPGLPLNKEHGLSRKTVFMETGKFLLFDFVCVLIWGVLLVCTLSLSDSFKELFSTRENIADSPPLKIIYIVVLAPVIEEIAFRLSLKPSMTKLALGLSFQLIIFLTIFGIIGFPLIVKILLMIVLSIVLWFFLNERVVEIIRKNFRFYLYYCILAFGLIHVSNYSFSNAFQVLFIPNLILIQLVLGGNAGHSIPPWPG